MPRPATPRPGAPSRPGAPVKAGNPTRPTPRPELVGKPQPRRAGAGGSRRRDRKPGMPGRPGAPTRPGPAPVDPHVPVHPHAPSRPGAPTRPGGPTRSAAAAPLNSSASRSDAMAAAPAGSAPDVLVLRRDPACPAACASRWPPAKLMQLQKPVGRPTAPPLRRPDAPTKPGDGPQATPPVARPTPPSAPRRPGSVPGAGPGGTAVPDVPTGMTAPSWKLCAAVRPRSNVRRSTSSARTTTPSPHRPVVTPESNRPWCSPPAWLAQPSRSHSNAQRRSRWRRCASARRKPPVSASVAGPWNCAQHGGQAGPARNDRGAGGQPHGAGARRHAQCRELRDHQIPLLQGGSSPRSPRPWTCRRSRRWPRNSACRCSRTTSRKRPRRRWR